MTVSRFLDAMEQTIIEYMDKTCNTCQHRNAQGICTNHDSVFFGCRVDDGACPVWGAKQQEPNKFAKYSCIICVKL